MTDQPTDDTLAVEHMAALAAYAADSAPGPIPSAPGPAAVRWVLQQLEDAAAAADVYRDAVTERRAPEDPGPAGDAQRGAEWPLRGRDGFSPQSFMDVLLAYVGDPDMIDAASVLWAYDTIRELAGLVLGLEAACKVLREPAQPSRGWGMSDAMAEFIEDAKARGKRVAVAKAGGVEVHEPEGGYWDTNNVWHPPPLAASGAPAWRTGHSVVPRVTLYKHDQLVGLALTEDAANEIVAAGNVVETGEPQVVEVVEHQSFTVGEATVSAESLALLLRVAQALMVTEGETRTLGQTIYAATALDLDTRAGLDTAVAELTKLLDAVDPAVDQDALDADMTLCDPNCPARVDPGSGAHHHIDPD